MPTKSGNNNQKEESNAPQKGDDANFARVKMSSEAKKTANWPLREIFGYIGYTAFPAGHLNTH